MIAHVVPKKTYLAVFAGLVLLTAITVRVALHDFGVFNTVIALTIAVTKAFLVVTFFMHLRYSHRLNWLVLGAALFWLMLLFAFTFADVFSRAWV